MRRGLALVSILGLAACGRIGFGAPDDAGGIDLDSDAPIDAVFIAAEPCNCTHVSAGAEHTCARLSTGGVVCWGDNVNGQVGVGDETDQLVPVRAGGIDTALDVVAGGNHTCARTTTEALCWGMDVNGQLGNGAAGGGSAPTFMTGAQDASALTASRWHTCVARETGEAACCGLNNYGQLVDGTSAGNRTTLTSVLGLTGQAASVAAGEYFTCIAGTDGQVQCAGEGVYGQLGDGRMATSPALVNVVGEGEVVQVVAGRYFACARTAGGAVLCWGQNNAGQLGDGTMTDRNVAAPVMEIVDAVDVTAGQNHACAVRATGVVVCWGANSGGQLGIGSNGPQGRPVPTQVPYLREATDVDAGDGHTCAIAAGGLYCWGDNSDGQLGTGTTLNYNSPVPVVVSL